MGEDVRKSVEPGDVIADKYRVERVIGRGGMGVVVAAKHIELGKSVALKFLLPNALGNKEAVARFEREARASVALQSDHVSHVHDVGRMPDGASYIVMELLEGRDLAHELHRVGGRMPIGVAVTYILQACDAISEAHALGIVHRDIKPTNLFLAKRPKKDPIIKVLDFGISKPTSLADAPEALTDTSALIGSPLYMSPEQLRAPKTVDGRSDIWSLAATLYELTCGSPPFDGATMAELSANILTAPAPDIRKHVPDAPEAFANALARAFAKSPDARFATVEDFASAIAPFAVAEGTGPRAAAISPALTPPRVEHTLPLLPTPVNAKQNEEPAEAKPFVVSDAAVSLPPSSPPVSAMPRFAIIGGALIAFVAGAVALSTRGEEKPKPVPLVASAPPAVSTSPPAIEGTPPPSPPPVASASAAASVSVAPAAVRVAPQIKRDAAAPATASAAPPASASAKPAPTNPGTMKINE